MTTDELITRARRAVETGQPRVAGLYMRKALEQVQEQRRELDPLGFACRDISEAVMSVAKGIMEVLMPAVDALCEVFSGTAKAIENSRQGDFVLVGPGVD